MTFFPDFTGKRSPRALWAGALAGDMAVFLLFAVLGRRSHGESGGMAHIFTTALPFIVGWFIVSLVTHPYSAPRLVSVRAAITVTAPTAFLGIAIGIALRSVGEYRIVPLGFAAVAVVFNMAMLLAWRVGLVAVAKRFV